MTPLTLKRFRLVLTFSCLALILGCSQKTAEEKGKELATEKIDIVKGVGAALEEKGEAAAESITTGAGSLISGVKKGISKSALKISSDKSLESAGLEISILQNTPPNEADKTQAIYAYIIAKAKAEGTLKAIAYNVLDKEIGRSSVELKKDTDEAKYNLIPFDKEVDISAISRVSFDFKPQNEAEKAK